MKISCSLFLIFTFVCVGKISSQASIEMKSKTKGFSIGANAAYLSYTASTFQILPNTAFGFGGQIQYGFSHQWAAALTVQHYMIDTAGVELINNPYPYTEIDLIGKYIFGSTNSVIRPFIVLGGNYTRQKEIFYGSNFEELNTIYSGFSGCGGVGLSIFFNTQISFELSGLYHFGYFKAIQNRIKYDYAYDFTAYKGLAGLSYHF